MDTIGAGCKCSSVKPTSHIPHLEKLILLVVKATIRERGCHGAEALVHLYFGLRLEQRISLMLDWLMERSLQLRILDEKIIYKHLPTHIDGDNLRRTCEIGYRHWVVRVGHHIPRWPLFRKLYAIVEHLSRLELLFTGQ